MKRTLLILSFATLAFAIGNTGCKKHDSGSVTTVDSGKVEFHIHTYVADSEIDGYNTIYQMANGRKLSLSLAQFYISEIELIRTDGTTYPLTGKILLKTLEQEEYELGNVPVGTYKAVRFKIGLDAATNVLPATANDVLNHSEMWFGSTAQPDGYTFLNAQGMIDTTTNANGTAAQMQPFDYRIGTSTHYVQVTLPDQTTPYNVTKGNTEFVHLLFDYSQLFNGITLNNPANLMIMTKADNSSALSNSVSNNIPAAVRYEE